VRKQTDGVAFFEIDDASTLEFKKARLAANGFNARGFIPGNYVASGVLPLLQSNGFDPDLPSFFIWEGNTMYLTRGAAMKVLDDFRKSVRPSAFRSTIWTRPSSRAPPAIPRPRASSSASLRWARRGTMASTMFRQSHAKLAYRSPTA
jgi:O-methyltransferase involved in polyketide biosynthesis